MERAQVFFMNFPFSLRRGFEQRFAFAPRAMYHGHAYHTSQPPALAGKRQLVSKRMKKGSDNFSPVCVKMSTAQ